MKGGIDLPLNAMYGHYFTNQCVLVSVLTILFLDNLKPIKVLIGLYKRARGMTD